MNSLWEFQAVFEKLAPNVIISPHMIYDLIILGGGPAGVAGAVYAARKRLETLLITEEFGGQSSVSETIYNWIGTPAISGAQLAKDLKKHAEDYNGKSLTLMEGVRGEKIQKKDNVFVVNTNDGKSFETRSVLVTTGSKRRKLEVPGAEEFENKGITYCASCDGPLFSDQDVVVIGGGNAGFESALQLVAYCKSVTLIHRSAEFRADEITVEKLRSNPKTKIIINADILKVSGTQFVESITYKDKVSGEEFTLPVTGIFVEVGQLPNTDFLGDSVDLDAGKKIVVDPMNQRASVAGIWAAGDATNGLYHQNNIAAGDAVKALEDLYIWVHKNK